MTGILNNKIIKDILKKTDSFAANVQKSPNQNNENNQSTNRDGNEEFRRQIGGPAAVAAKKQKIIKSIKLSSFLKLYHSLLKNNAEEINNQSESAKKSGESKINSKPIKILKLYIYK